MQFPNHRQHCFAISISALPRRPEEKQNGKFTKYATKPAVPMKPRFAGTFINFPTKPADNSYPQNA